MCGIIGSFPIENQSFIENGLQRVAHRGPDALRQIETQYGSLGHARLAILDVAEGHQPMTDGKRWIVFNGEIYNYAALQSQLGGTFVTQSDTEVILRCYAEKGIDCPALLDGMFAFAIIDGGTLFLARDPIGIKPLYYASVQGVLYFASEIKALLPFATNIQEFPAGYSWHSKFGFHCYDLFAKQNPERTQGTPDSLPVTEKLIQESLLNAVTKRLISDPGVPVGISLSGGLDSSIIAALASRVKERVDTFAVGMAGSEDLSAAQVMASFLNTHHHSYTYTFAEMLKALPEIIYHLESYDAALIRSAIPNYFLARLASDHVKVILTGEGADELFAGYEYLRSYQDLDALHHELWTITSNLHNTNLQRTDRMTMAHGIEGRVPFLDRNVIDMVFRIPAEWKAPGKDRIEKGLLRKSFSETLPAQIVWRTKQKFSKGTGSADLMADFARNQIADTEFQVERDAFKEAGIRSKEELMYYRIFREQFGENVPNKIIGRTRSITANELN